MLSTTLWASFFFALTARAGKQPVIDTGYAKYLGNLTFPDSVAYLGIPYAEPPLGDLRFRATVSLNTTRIRESSGGEVVDATEYPNFCIQGSIGAGDAGGAGGEDCLKVNIYAPLKATKNSKLPVLVYFHGGGYVYGNPANWPFNRWVHQDQNVVIVSVYYRLDAFGFLAIPEFADGKIGDLNVGFLDQIQSLKWVKTNIASFGGDPGRVTINGESAGGGSVQLHLVANEGEELFQAAIAQSVYRTYVGTPQERIPLFKFFASAAGCADDDDDVARQMTCLRNASVSALARAQDAAVGPYHLFVPVLDGKVVTENPTRAILKGNFRKVPLVVGATSNETLSDSSQLGPPLKAFFPALANTTIASYEKVYPLSEFGGNETLRNTVAHGDSELRCAGLATYTYRFNQANPTSGSAVVGHAAENWWMFLGTNTGFNGTTTFTPMTPSQMAFAEELIAYWLSFVRSHNPSTFKLERSPSWPQFTSNDRARIVLAQAPGNSTTASGSSVETISITETKQCEFVASIAREQED
ncbi:alpha beta-hydrolase [Vararia minispora EC-137]|uniref:Alpha beta-hydrolase n=1 Tax=Vararia minispora EC-137 TaxID=1314806 RepID=A0ACB8Q8X0_9AGAM|nr:alpha beta-hydrolase [Vararia minispora EC-137]